MSDSSGLSFCMETLSIGDTTVEIYEYIFPQYINPAGTLFGGKMLYFIAQCASLSANKVARGPVVMASMDSVDFIEPVNAGDVLVFRGRVQYTSRSSMEIGVSVWKEKDGERRIVTLAHLAYVAVDDEGRPRSLEVKVEPKDEHERKIYEWGQRKRAIRLNRVKDRKKEIYDTDTSRTPTYSLYSSKIIFPNETFFSKIIFAGYLFEKVDELSAILALRYARIPIVTASIDDFDFFTPLKVGDIAHFYLGINYVGNRSMEIGVKILKEHPFTGELLKVCSSYITMVATNKLPKFNPWNEYEKKRWEEAEARKFMRMERVKRFKECLSRNELEPIC